jgi:hypothetical protein
LVAYNRSAGRPVLREHRVDYHRTVGVGAVCIRLAAAGAATKSHYLMPSGTKSGAERAP